MGTFVLQRQTANSKTVCLPWTLWTAQQQLCSPAMCKKERKEALVTLLFLGVFSRLTKTACAAKIDVMNNPQIGGSEA